MPREVRVPAVDDEPWWMQPLFSFPFIGDLGVRQVLQLLAYTTPVMLVLTVSLVTGLSTSFASGVNVSSELTDLVPIGSVSIESDLLNEIKSSMLLSSIALAVLTSKTIDFTVRNTLRAIIVIVVSIIAFYTIQPLAEEIIRSFL